jgi:hypothetical protein
VVNTTGVAADFHHSVGQTFATPNYTIYEGFYQFDTSGIGDTDTIDSAVFSLHGHTDNSVTDFTINCRLKDWGTGLTTADWVAGADLSALTLLATFATSGFTTSGYNDFTSAGKHGSHRWRRRQRPLERCTTMGPSLPADPLDRQFNVTDSFGKAYLEHCHEIHRVEDMLWLTSTGFTASWGFDLGAGRFSVGYHVTRSYRGRIARKMERFPRYSVRVFAPNAQMHSFPKTAST